MRDFTRIPTEAEIAWAAGLYEGEGSIWYNQRDHTPVLTISSTDRDVLAQFERFMGGRLGSYVFQSKEAHHKPKHSWRATSWRDVIRICGWIRPWLLERRGGQVDAVLAHQPAHPRGETMCPEVPFPSTAGYQRHIRLGEKPCEICRQSNRLFVNTRKVSERYYAKVRDFQRQANPPTEIHPGPPTATRRGYMKHRRAGEAPCDTCRESDRMYWAEFRAKGKG